MSKFERMSIKKIINMDIKDFNKLTKEDLSVINKKLRIQSNRLIKRFEKHNIYSPSYYGYIKGESDINEQTIQGMRAEFRRNKNFLKAETSTLKGYKEYKRKIIESLSEEGIELSNKQYDDFFEVYDKLVELDKTIAETAFKYNVMKTVGNYIEDKKTIDVDEVVSEMYEKLNDIYERNQEIDDVSDFFQLDEEE